MTERLIIAGAGGQGIMLLGKVLATAVMQENKYVTWLPAYGPEVRGGTAHCMVIISDLEIGSPCIKQADSLIIMNAASLERFSSRLKPKGLLIINSSLAGDNVRSLAMLHSHPFSDIAFGLGNIKVANMVALGCYIAQKKIVAKNTVLKVINEINPQAKSDLIKINQQAVKAGAEL
jgi:2-oxoglutarate ferredoxin oxidoreductase subunit gamma